MDERRRPYNLFQHEGNVSLILYLALLGPYAATEFMTLFPRGRKRGLIQKGFFCPVLDTSIFIALSL